MVTVTKGFKDIKTKTRSGGKQPLKTAQCIPSMSKRVKGKEKGLVCTTFKVGPNSGIVT